VEGEVEEGHPVGHAFDVGCEHAEVVFAVFADEEPGFAAGCGGVVVHVLDEGGGEGGGEVLYGVDAHAGEGDLLTEPDAPVEEVGADGGVGVVVVCAEEVICVAIFGVDIFGPAVVAGADKFVNRDLAIEVVIIAAAEVRGGIFHTAMGVSSSRKVPT